MFAAGFVVKTSERGKDLPRGVKKNQNINSDYNCNAEGTFSYWHSLLF